MAEPAGPVGRKRRGQLTRFVAAARAPSRKSTPRAEKMPMLVVKRDPVWDAVKALQNNEIKTTVETKSAVKGMPHGDAPQVMISYPPEILTALRGMFPASKTYVFEIHAAATLASIGGGVFNTTISWSPAVTSFAEWSALSALFDEVVLHSTTLDVNSAFGPTSSAIAVQIAIAPDETTTSGSTPSFTAVQRLAESEFIHVAWLGHSSSPGAWRKTHRVTSRPYATTAVPAGASGTPSGCLGHWAFASNIVTTPSINLLFVALSQRVRLRCRA